MVQETHHAELFNRFLAKAIDVSLGLGLCFLVPPFGTFLGIIYLFIGDALWDGSSAAKWLIGLRCTNSKTQMPCSFRESVLRNIPFGLPATFLLIPLFGLVLCVIVAVAFIGLESYFLYTDPNGTRLGDALADTHVTASSPRRRSPS